MIWGLLLVLTSTAAKSLFEQESGDFLPEETFRKLAAVLYRRGDKVENRLTRKYLYNTNVTCNDGSTAGYYIRRNQESRRWIIYLEGGWFCYDETSCEARWLRLRTLMSSDRLDSYHDKYFVIKFIYFFLGGRRSRLLEEFCPVTEKRILTLQTPTMFLFLIVPVTPGQEQPEPSLATNSLSLGLRYWPRLSGNCLAGNS